MNAVATKDQVRAMDPKEALATIQGKTVILQLSVGSIGSQSRVSNSDVNAEAEQDRLKMSKGIMKSPWLSLAGGCAQKTQGRLRELGLPSLLKSGLYQLPIAMIGEVDMYLTAQRTEWANFVEQFMQDYQNEDADGLKARDRAALQVRVMDADVDLYRDNDYPSASAVRSCFKWEHRYFTFATPSSLSDISAELYARELEKAEALAQKQMDEVNELLCQQMRSLIEHVHDRLLAEPGGKKKVIRDGLTERINDFLAHFDARNVFGNEELAGLAEQARAALKGADGEALRSAPILRANVAAAFEEIKSKLNGMIGDAPVRAISLDDEA